MDHSSMQQAILDREFVRIFEQTSDLWDELRGNRLFLTGGTGLFGYWLLESFAHANRALDLGASVVVLTRNQDRFQARFPRLAADPAIAFHEGDVKASDFPEGRFSHVIHMAATSAAETFQNADLLDKFDTVVGGTRRVLEFAESSGAKKVLYTSSGVVYGKQPPEMTHVPEEYRGAPETVDTGTLPAWGTAKRTAEFLCGYYAAQRGIEVKIARCFTFTGPLLPLDIHYAIGNFIRDAMRGGPIRILGDGSPRRSYLYMSDLAVWLWTILFRGASQRPYNVGSEEDVSIGELARAVAAEFAAPIEVEIAKTPVPGAAPDRYVPATRRAAGLGLRRTVDLREAIRRTAAYYGAELASR